MYESREGGECGRREGSVGGGRGVWEEGGECGEEGGEGGECGSVGGGRGVWGGGVDMVFERMFERVCKCVDMVF